MCAYSRIGNGKERGLYRDMAERIKAEKRILHNRILHNEMCRKLEVVREHYRNKVIESGSRGGVMVG